jgi:hypothetical protein
MAHLQNYVHVARARVQPGDGDTARAVYRSEIIRAPDGDEPLEQWLTGKVPFYYRDPAEIARSFQRATDFRKPIRDTLLRLPSAASFQESHFGEILAAVFCEQILDLKRLYSKLALLSAENTNAHKMDLVLYEELKDTVAFVLAEVKSSTKQGPAPARHDRGCFAELFRSLNDYREQDLEFDLAVIEDRMREMPDEDAQRIRRALQPDADTEIRYAGVCVIDSSTHREQETRVLSSRAAKRDFDVELLCVAELSEVASLTYARLQELRGSV